LSKPGINEPPGPRRGLCLVVAAPSGAGKSTITRALLRDDPALILSISATTRAARAGEIEGVHYLFRSEAEFAAMVAAGELIECAGVFGRNYGTPRAPVLAALAAGRDGAFDIDWQGHRQLRAALPGDTVGVFIMPPSIAMLRTRLEQRGDAPRLVEQRMDGALAEMSHWREFDYLVVNAAVEDAVATVQAILTAARCATGRRSGQPLALP
jgi:guanylate kinase